MIHDSAVCSQIPQCAGQYFPVIGEEAEKLKKRRFARTVKVLQVEQIIDDLCPIHTRKFGVRKFRRVRQLGLLNCRVYSLYPASRVDLRPSKESHAS